MLPHFDILYKIYCKDGHSGAHSAPAFRDVPSPIEYEFQNLSVRSLHLNGTVPVFDLEAFMENDTDDLAFVVVRMIECSEASVQIASAGGHLRWTESIYMKSKKSKHAMQKVATCYFQSVSKEKEDNSYPPMSPTPGVTRELFEQNRITPARLFFFHHRELLRVHALEYPESKQHVNALFKYIDDCYGREFAEADILFTRGLVTQAQILKLFRPNELIISGTYGKPAAFVLQEWPKLRSDGWVTLSCWSFQTDGSGFARKKSLLSIPPIESETTKIQNLVAYPLHFATDELQELIRSRGKKQWQLRTATQITYKGWNVKGDQFFVSQSLSRSFVHSTKGP